MTKILKALVVVFFLPQWFLAQKGDFAMVDFTKAENLAKLQEGASLEHLPNLVSNLTKGLSTDVEKCKAIYYWVCHNVTGDDQQHRKVEKSHYKYKEDTIALRYWSTAYKREALRKLIKNKKTMCTGYAYLIKEMCFLVGIKAEIIKGYGRTIRDNRMELQAVNHAWNALFIEGKWYFCDATWSSGYMKGGAFIANYNEGYFLTEPSFFAFNHFPKDLKWRTPNANRKEGFKEKPFVYNVAFQKEVYPLYPKSMENSVDRGENIAFQLRVPSDFDSASMQLVCYNGDKEQQLPIKQLRVENETLYFEYAFRSKGTFDVHVKVDNVIISTYVFNVRNSKAIVLQ